MSKNYEIPYKKAKQVSLLVLLQAYLEQRLPLTPPVYHIEKKVHMLNCDTVVPDI